MTTGGPKRSTADLETGLLKMNWKMPDWQTQAPIHRLDMGTLQHDLCGGS